MHGQVRIFICFLGTHNYFDDAYFEASELPGLIAEPRDLKRIMTEENKWNQELESILNLLNVANARSRPVHVYAYEFLGSDDEH